MQKSLWIVILIFNLAYGQTEGNLSIDGDDSMTFRPHFGFGSDGSVYYGGRMLLDAGGIRKYGLEVSKFKTNDDSFEVFGIVLEQRLWSWFNMSIGTVGYFNYGADNQHVIGLTSNLGWEPDTQSTLKPFITYRTDVIFLKENIDAFHSINIGFGFAF